MKIQVVIEAESIHEYTEAIKALAAGYTVAPQPSFAVAVDKSRTVTTYGEAKQAVESDVAEDESSEPKEQSYHRTAKKYYNELVDIASEEAVILFNTYEVESINYLSKSKCTQFTTQLKEAILKHTEAPKEEKSTTEPKAEKQVENEPSEAPKQSETAVSFVDVKLKAKQLANLPGGKEDIKFILDKLGAKKLSDLTEDQYATFMEMAIEGEDNINTATEFSKNMDKVVPKEEKTSEDAEVTLEMIRSKAKELSVAGYKEEIKAALKGIGATALTKIPKDQYAAFYATMGEIQ